MKPIALPVYAFAALLIVTVGCERGGSDDIMTPSATQMIFAGSPTAASTGAPVAFTVTANNPQGVELLVLSIDFESDGIWDEFDFVQGLSVNLTFTHAYASVGKYTAVAQLSDNTPAMIKRTVQVNVTAPPPVSVP